MLRVQNRTRLNRMFIYRNVTVYILCLLNGAALVDAGIVPFGMAFLCAVLSCGANIFAALLGACTGFCVSGFFAGIPASFLLCLFALWLRRFVSAVPEKFLFAVGAVLISLSAFIFGGFGLYSAVSAVICFLGTVFVSPLYNCALKCLREKGPVGVYEKICIGIFIAGCLLGLCSCGEIGKNASLFIVCLAANALGFFCGTGTGAAFGCMAGSVLALKGLVYAPAMLSFAGALSGVFRSLGKIGASCAFLTGALFMIWCVCQSLVPEAYVSVSAAFLFLIAIPKKWIDEINALLDVSLDSAINGETKAMREFALIRLIKLMPVLSSLSLAFCKKEVEEFSIDSVCDGCKEYYECGIRQNEKTMNEFVHNICGHERNQMKHLCRYYDEMVNHARLFTAQKICAGNISRQLRAFCDMTGGICEKLTARYRCDTELSGKITRVLSMKGIQIKNVVAAYEGDCLRVKLTAQGCGAMRRCESVIAPAVSSCAGIKMQCTSYGCVCRKGECELNFRRIENLSPVIGASRKMVSGESMCGDSYAFGRLEDERFYVLLSDGMGCGREARQLSLSAVKLVEDYLNAGLDIALAAETANRYMSTISGGKERFATLDMNTIDLSSGELSYVKVSACHSYILSGDKLETLSDSSLPLGMFDDLSMRKKRAKLHKNDLLIMMSDGICDENVLPQDEFMNLIKGDIDRKNPQAAADLILDRSKHMIKGVDDDRTVLVLRIL